MASGGTMRESGMPGYGAKGEAAKGGREKEG